MNACPACGSDRWIVRIDLAPWRYVSCDGCDLVRVDPFPTTTEAEALYGDDYFNDAANAGYDDYVADAAVHRRNGRGRLRRLGPSPRSSASLVDVGCAFGYTMLEAREAGWLPAGVDANATAREAVRAEGMACEASLGDLGLEPHSVGAVTFFQSLEHMPDPLGSLAEARDLLAHDGSVLVETWDRSSRTARISGSHWQQLSPPSVLWLLDEKSLSRLAKEAGLRLESWRWSTKWVTLGLVAGQLTESGSGLGKAIGRARSLPLPYFLGDLVTARLRPA